MHDGIKHLLFLITATLVLVPLVLSHGIFALEVISAARITLPDPIQDDVAIFGETVHIDAPVKGAIIFANNVYVNASIEGNLIDCGQINVNSNISGKIVSAANTIELRGKSTNVLLAANNIQFGPTSVILKDVYIVGENVNNDGNI